MLPKTKLILNPMADLGHAGTTVDGLRPLADTFGGTEWVRTERPAHAVELARQAGEQGCERVIAVGGDGTVHEVINGLMQVPPERRPLLGIVPLGSGNDFALAAGIPSEPAEALKRAMTGTAREIDLGCMRDDRGRSAYIDNTLGIGFDTIVTIRSRRLTKFRGFMIYFVAVIQTILLDYVAPRMHIETPEEQWDDHNLMLVLCNGPREGGGFLVAPQARNDDGILHYTAIRRINRAMMFRLLPEVMKGTHGRFKPVRMGTFRKMSLWSEQPLYIHIDGEVYSGFDSDVRGLSVEILPGAIKVIC